MNSLTINEKIKDAFPYFYFSAYFLILLLNQFYPLAKGTGWNVILVSFLAMIFILQFIYRLKYLDAILGGLTLIGSVWMLLAAYSDLLYKSSWTLNEIGLLVIVFVILNFYSAINLLMKGKHGNAQ